MTTVIEHVLSRLRGIGIKHVFGVPGDFAFPVSDAIVADGEIAWIGCCNELNAAYAADGYARVNGVAAVSTTFGVGELAANAGIAGSYSENVPVFHLVGMPSTATQASSGLIHHTLGDRRFDVFKKMAESIVCASAIMTPDNVVHETDRLVTAALYERRPVYMAFPFDLATQEIVDMAPPVSAPRTDRATMQTMIEAVVGRLSAASSACILPGILCSRLGLQEAMTSVVEASNLPFATMFGDKSVLDEQHPAYVGMYAGTLMNEEVRGFVESCDCIVIAGSMMSDFNTAAFTARLDEKRLVIVAHHHVQIGSVIYPNLEIGDVLLAMAESLPRFPQQKVPTLAKMAVPRPVSGPVMAELMYPLWERFICERDIVVAEAGTISMGMAFAHLPAGATFINQPLWNAIGWATPAAFGAAMAAPDRRVVLFTGEGSHQLTAQEVGQFARYGLRPIIFILNNGGYLIERLLCDEPGIEYNDLAQWRYSELPRVLGCEDWHTARVETAEEFELELEHIGSSNSAAYLEVVTQPYEASRYANRIHENISSLYWTVAAAE